MGKPKLLCFRSMTGILGWEDMGRATEAVELAVPGPLPTVNTIMNDFAIFSKVHLKWGNCHLELTPES